MAIQIQDLDPAMELHSIKSGLKASPFADSLAITPPKTTTEFKKKAVGYINMEEDREMKKAEARQEAKNDDDSKQSYR